MNTKLTLIILSLLLLSNNICLAQNLSDSLLIHYTFNGNYNDFSGNSHNGDGNATAIEDRFGNVNSAYHFNGIDQSVSLPVAAALKPNFPISVSAWVKFENFIQSNNNILTTDYTEDQYYGVWLNTDGTGRPAINYGDGDFNSTNSSSRRSKIGDIQLELNTWYMITGVVRGPTDMDLYVNCENVGGYYNGLGDDLSYSANPGAIGRGDVLGAAPYFFRGTIDEVYYWSRDLSPLDIEALIDTGYVQTIYETICLGDTFYYNNAAYYSSGTYEINTPNLSNCLSNVILELSVDENCICRFKEEFDDPQNLTIVNNDLFGFIEIIDEKLQVFYLENGPQSTSAWVNMLAEEQTNSSFSWSFEFNPEYSISQSKVFIALTDSTTAIANRREGINYIPNNQDAIAVVIQPDMFNTVNVSLMVKDENKAFIYNPVNLLAQPIISNNLTIPNSLLSIVTSTNYYITVTKFNELNYQLSIFSDSARTQHYGNSPICLNIDESESPAVDGLNYFQIGNNIQNTTVGNFVCIIDNVCIGDFSSNFEITGPDEACEGEVVTFIIPTFNQSSGIIVWDIPPGAQIVTTNNNAIELQMGGSSGILTATLDLGCFELQLTKNIISSTNSSTQIVGSTSVCPGDSTLLSITGNFNSISWNSIQSNLTTYYASPGIVYVSAISDNGCSVLDSVEIITLPISSIELTTNSLPCNNDSIWVSASGNFSTYIWNGAIEDGSDFYTVPGQITVQNPPGTGCTTTDTINIASNNILADFDVEPDSIIQLGNEFSFIDQSSSTNSNLISWEWDFGFSFGQENIQSPFFTYADTGSYTVTLTITSDAGCLSSTSKIVKVVSGVKIPNVFSPNGDDINDTFVIELNGLKAKIVLNIYSRWGRLIYENEDYKNDWNGENSTDGLFYYVIEIENLGIFKGYLQSINN